MPRSTLLVIDDEPNILTTVRRSLEIEGFVIRRATVGFDIPAAVRLGNGLPLLPDPPTTALPAGR